MERRFPGFGSDEAADPVAFPEPSRAAPSNGPEQRRALLIGNGAYRQAPLRNPRRDIRLVGEALTQIGFAVTLIEDGDFKTMRHAVAEFVASLAASDPDTIAFFYFAGHGLQVDGANYLVPAHAEIASPRDLPSQALALEDVVAQFSASVRRASILVLDACRDGTFATGTEDRQPFSGGLASLNLPPAGMLVAYSTAAGRAANDGTGVNSPYAKALVETLPRLLEPGRRVHDIFVETAEKVREATGGKQAPALFLQGGLPALTLAPDDADRRRTYDPWGPARARRVALLTGMVIFAVLLATFVGLVWSAMDPIDKRAWLSHVGLADPPGLGLSCSGTLASDVDAYGLTAGDWCELMPDDLYQLVLKIPNVRTQIEAGIAAGDPKALFLQAIDTATRFPDEMADLDGIAKDDVIFHLDRAARSGLSVAGFYWDLLERDGLLSKRYELLVAAAADGHLLSQAQLAVLDVEHGEITRGVATLEDLQAREPSGHAAYLLSLILGGDVSTEVEVDNPRAIELARASVRKGYLPAIGWLFELQKRGTLRLEPAETDAMMQRLYEGGREAGYWWHYDRLTATLSPQDDAAALDLLREMMARFPNGPAAYQFAQFAIRGVGGPVPSDELSRAVDQAVRARTPYARTLRGELRMGLIKGPDHLPFLPIDPVGALADLQASWDLTQDPRAILLLARYHLLGVAGAPNLEAAKAVLQIALTESRGVSLQMLDLQGSVDLTELMAANRSDADIDLGVADAPVTVTVYFDPDCGGCTQRDLVSLKDALDWLSATYLRHGFARLALRPVVEGDGVTPGLLRLACLGPTDETVLGRLFGDTTDQSAGQSRCLDPETLAKPNADRLALLHTMVFSNDAAIAPDNLPDVEGPLLRVPPQTLPVIVVNGWVLSTVSPQALEVTIYHLLAPAQQVRARALGAQTCQDAAQAKLIQTLIDGPVTEDLPPRLIPSPAPSEPLSGLAADEGVLCAVP